MLYISCWPLLTGFLFSLIFVTVALLVTLPYHLRLFAPKTKKISLKCDEINEVSNHGTLQSTTTSASGLLTRFLLYFLCVTVALAMALPYHLWLDSSVRVNHLEVSACCPLTLFLWSLFFLFLQLLSQWLCLIIYGWTLLAPYLLRDYRDFGIEFDF